MLLSSAAVSAASGSVAATVSDYGKDITFSYSTFEPNTRPGGSEPRSPYARPIPHGQGYELGINQENAGAFSVDHSDFWGFANAIQFGWSTQASPVVVNNSWFHNTRDGAGVDHTDGIADHYGGVSYVVIHHNTIVGDGDTNALALQGSSKYSHITITGNYFSGYGEMVNSGSDMLNTHMTFTGNVWGSDFKPTWSPLYGNNMYTAPGLHNVWKNNTLYVRPGTTWMAKGNSGMYWWPTDSNPRTPRQIIGHRRDFVSR